MKFNWVLATASLTVCGAFLALGAFLNAVFDGDSIAAIIWAVVVCACAFVAAGLFGGMV